MWTPDSGRTKGLLLQQSQERSFPKEVECLQQHQPVPWSSSIAQRTPLLGADGLMRVGGRLQRTELVMDQQHPIILHHRDRLTNLIAVQTHESNMHVGPTGLMAVLSLRFNIVGGKQLVKSISKSCFRCLSFYVRTAQQLMGQLPACRATPAPAFHTTGPFNLRRGHVR